MNLIVSWQERWRSALGAGFGIGVAGLSSWWLLAPWTPGMPWLIAPIGASALLVFTISASPLAQPWAVLVGNVISAAVGLLCVQVLGASVLAMAFAVMFAILMMFATQSLHPPGAAVALLMVLSPVAHPWLGLGVVFFNTLMVVFAGLIYNNLTGKTYPHRAYAEPLNEHTFRRELELVLTKHNDVVDINLDDLEVLIEEAMSLKRQSNSQTPPSES